MPNAIGGAQSHIHTPKIAEQKPLNPAQQAKAAGVTGREFGQLVASIAKAKHDPVATPPAPTTPTPEEPATPPVGDPGVTVDITI